MKLVLSILLIGFGVISPVLFYLLYVYLKTNGFDVGDNGLGVSILFSNLMFLIASIGGGVFLFDITIIKNKKDEQ